MSAPRLTLEIKLYGTNCRFSRKLKARLGNHKELQEEIQIMVNNGEFERFSEHLVKNNGGIEKIRQEWNDYHLSGLEEKDREE
jgi:hypothetical protein